MLVKFTLADDVEIVHVSGKEVIIEVDSSGAWYTKHTAKIQTFNVKFRDLRPDTKQACQCHKNLGIGKKGGIYAG